MWSETGHCYASRLFPWVEHGALPQTPLKAAPKAFGAEMGLCPKQGALPQTPAKGGAWGVWRQHGALPIERLAPEWVLCPNPGKDRRPVCLSPGASGEAFGAEGSLLRKKAPWWGNSIEIENNVNQMQDARRLAGRLVSERLRV